MKKKWFVSCSLIICMYISGCSKNNLDDDLANRKLDHNKTEPTRVNYNTPNHGGPAITSVDTSDPEIDRQPNQSSRILNNNSIHYGTSKIMVVSQAANKVNDLKEINHANIIVTDNNAFVAVKLEKSTRNQLTPTIRNKITWAVKSVDSNIESVYISKNPYFYNRMMKYTAKISQGQTSPNLIDEFSDTIRRVFPYAR